MLAILPTSVIRNIKGNHRFVLWYFKKSSSAKKGPLKWYLGNIGEPFSEACTLHLQRVHSLKEKSIIFENQSFTIRSKIS